MHEVPLCRAKVLGVSIEATIVCAQQHARMSVRLEYCSYGTPLQCCVQLLQAYRQLIEKVTDHLRDVPASRTNSAVADVIINYERRLLEVRLAPHSLFVLFVVACNVHGTC